MKRSHALIEEPGDWAPGGDPEQPAHKRLWAGAEELAAPRAAAFDTSMLEPQAPPHQLNGVSFAEAARPRACTDLVLWTPGPIVSEPGDEPQPPRLSDAPSDAGQPDQEQLKKVWRSLTPGQRRSLRGMWDALRDWKTSGLLLKLPSQSLDDVPAEPWLLPGTGEMVGTASSDGSEPDQHCTVEEITGEDQGAPAADLAAGQQQQQQQEGLLEELPLVEAPEQQAQQQQGQQHGLGLQRQQPQQATACCQQALLASPLAQAPQVAALGSWPHSQQQQQQPWLAPAASDAVMLDAAEQQQQQAAQLLAADDSGTAPMELE